MAITYQVYRSTASSGPWTLVDSGLSSPTDTINNLAASTSYYFQVVATDSASGLSSTTVGGPFATASATTGESPDYTLVSGTSGTIVASQTPGQAAPANGPFDIWSINASAQAVKQTGGTGTGTADTQTSNVTTLYYRRHSVYHENTDNNWYCYLLNPRQAGINKINDTANYDAQVGTPGILPDNWSLVNAGLTQTVVGFDVDQTSRLPYIDIKLAGNLNVTAGNNYTLTYFDKSDASGITVTPNTQYTLSVYLCAPSTGTDNVANVAGMYLQWAEYSQAGGAYYIGTGGSVSIPYPLPTTLTRYSVTATTGSTTTAIAPCFHVDYASTTAAANHTIRFCAPQFEQAATPSAFSLDGAGHWVQTSSPEPTNPPAPINATHYGTSAPTTLRNDLVGGAQSPLGWTVVFFDDFDSFTCSTTQASAASAVTNQWSTTMGTIASGAQLSAAVRQQAQSQIKYLDPYITNGAVNPFSCSNSILTITGSVPTSSQTQYVTGTNGVAAQFIGGCLSTESIRMTGFDGSQMYGGYFEINAQLPTGFGMWPAFWLTGTNSWPPEYDIMEAQGAYPNITTCANHWGNAGAYSGSGSVDTGTNTQTGFHTYGGLWCPNYTATYFDGKLINQNTDGTAGGGYTGSLSLDTTAPMYIIINLAAGAFGGGSGATSASFPTQFKIDWVRFSALGPA